MTIAMTPSRKPPRAIGRLHPLLAVLAWELRRLRVSRSAWLLPLIMLGLFLFILWTAREPIPWGPLNVYGNHALLFTFGSTIDAWSAWGLTLTLPTGLLFLLALLLPFVSADGVALDLKRHTHELLMTTALPSWAYVWGRFLAVISLSLGLALLQLAAILMMGLALHLSVGGPDYPTPQVGAIIALWAAMILPAAALVSSLSFALGLLLPRQTTLVKVGLITLWFIGAQIIPSMQFWTDPQHPAWYADWDPTSAVLWRAFHYDHTFTQAGLTFAPHPTREHLVTLFQRIEYQEPDLWAWLGPHLFWAALGLTLVVIAATTFHRFSGRPK